MQAKSLLIAAVVFLFALTVAAQQGGEANSDWKQVEGALGRSGQMQPGGVIKFAMPRKDLSVTVGGTQVKAGLALGSWVAFEKSGNDGMAMGDLVLAESEVEPVMKKLEDGGVQITALHNHLLGETPRVMYMHIAAHGNAVKIAQTLNAALALTKTPPASPAPAASNEKVDLDTAQIEQVLGHKGKLNNGIFQVSVPRAEKITDGGMEVPPSMGTATAINFQPTGGGKAAITGDFVLLGSEVNPVLAALRAGGIDVTAVHSHMLTEEPRLFFMHYWANDDAVKLAKTLHNALDKTNSAK